jgi:hypothetical protein
VTRAATIWITATTRRWPNNQKPNRVDPSLGNRSGEGGGGLVAETAKLMTDDRIMRIATAM